MKSVELSQFYRAVTRWPETDAELVDVAGETARLLGQPLAAAGIGGRVGVSLSTPQVETGLDAEQFRALLEKQASDAAGSAGVRQVQAAGFQLAIAPVVGSMLDESRSEGGRSTRVREPFGWLAVGSVKPLGGHEEMLLLAAAQRLAELAELTKLEGSIRLRNQFLSIASHELKTPLTSIYGMLQLQERMLRLKRDEPVNVQQERQHSYLKIVIRQVERLNELIDALLDVSRIQAGRFMVEPSDTDVALLLRETIQNRLTLIAQEAGVSLNADMPERLVAFVDPVRMEEVVTNLVMNAIRFSPEGGVVWIRLREEDGAFRLTVRDQGPSLSREDQERIFQPFERTHRTGRLGGLGLGLFISLQIAQLHGGDVRLAESIPGKGNVLEARFPLRARRSVPA
jgi:signal transduction histidine kinase